MPTTRSRTSLTLLTLFCLPLLACGGDDGGPAPPPPAATYEISIINGIGYKSDSNMTSAPAVDTVSAGTKVRWTWQGTGTVAHNVTSVGSPSFPGSADLNTGGSQFSHTFSTPGTYNYQCTQPGHAAAGMIGTIVVQ